MENRESKTRSISSNVAGKIGDFFYNLGFQIASSPWSVILCTLMVVALCSTGFLWFHNEKDPMNLWIPKGSRFAKDTEWLVSRFKEGTRTQSILITAPEVLTVEVLRKLLQIHTEITTFTVKTSAGAVYDFEDVCFKIPSILGFSKFRKKRHWQGNDITKLIYENKNSNRSNNHPFAPSVDLDPDFFCDIVNNLPKVCMLQNILELWKFEKTKFENLTKESIIEVINKTKTSAYSGHEQKFSHLLGGIIKNNDGKIISATSILSHYMLHVNFSEHDSNKFGNAAGTEDWTSERAMMWENQFIKRMLKLKRELENEQIKIYYSAGRSYGDISSETMFSDMDKIIVGAILMSVYMQLILSKFGWTEIRTALGSLGLLSVGMAFICGCGVCSFLRIPYGPIHTSLPFLLMGLGVDDMFVMMAVYRKQQDTNGNINPRERMGNMLKHAGASITVTSVTDIMAFAVGAFTVLPSLQSFCIYSAFSVFFNYIFVCTFFVAIFTLDERRIKQRRNSFVPCIVHKPENTIIWFEKNLMQSFIKKVYKNFILKKMGKALVIFLVFGMTTFNIFNLYSLKQKFDPSFFIPSNSYLGQYIASTRKLYPNLGAEVSVVLGQLEYTAQMQNLLELQIKLESQTDLLYDIEGWPIKFQEFVKVFHNKNSTQLSDIHWRQYLAQFLFSNQGGKFQPNFRFDGDLECGKPTPNVTMSQISFKFKRFYEREEYIPAKKKIESLVDEAKLNSGEGFSTVWGRIFGNWVTDEIIDVEIYRNIGLALVGVMICTALVIFNLHVCFWIFITVLLTLVNVGGSMHFLGMTLDIVSCIALQLSIGLGVDYAAHIGHAFLTMDGVDRNERALNAVLHIGSAVIYGGSSTILALIMLYNSEAYTYRAFFRIFFFVVAYGLFHGIVLLPVILSIIGPKPYKTEKYQDTESENMENLTFIAKSKPSKE